MNDYLSESLPPSETEIKKILFDEINPYCKLEDEAITLCINKAFEDFGGMDKIGSLTGWLMFSKKDLLQMTIKRLNYYSAQTRSPPFSSQTE